MSKELRSIYLLLLRHYGRVMRVTYAGDNAYRVTIEYGRGCGRDVGSFILEPREENVESDTAAS